LPRIFKTTQTKKLKERKIWDLLGGSREKVSAEERKANYVGDCRYQLEAIFLTCGGERLRPRGHKQTFVSIPSQRIEDLGDGKR